MSVCIDYKDTIRLISVNHDGYATETIAEDESVPAMFAQNTGWSHGGNQTDVTSDAFCLVDPANDFVVAHWNRLEGMLVVAQLFAVPATEAWYRITNVQVSRDALLCNRIDTVRLSLKKSTPIS